MGLIFKNGYFQIAIGECKNGEILEGTGLYSKTIGYYYEDPVYRSGEIIYQGEKIATFCNGKVGKAFSNESIGSYHDGIIYRYGPFFCENAVGNYTNGSGGPEAAAYLCLFEGEIYRNAVVISSEVNRENEIGVNQTYSYSARYDYYTLFKIVKFISFFLGLLSWYVLINNIHYFIDEYLRSIIVFFVSLFFSFIFCVLKKYKKYKTIYLTFLVTGVIFSDVEIIIFDFNTAQILISLAALFIGVPFLYTLTSFCPAIIVYIIGKLRKL